MTRRILCLMVLLVGCVLVVTACTTDSPIAGRTYWGEVETSGPGTADITIEVSTDGQSITSLSLTSTADAWAGPGISPPASFSFLNHEPHSFGPGEVPIVDGIFRYSCAIPGEAIQEVAAVAGTLIQEMDGQFDSATRASGTIRVAVGDRSQPARLLEYRWSASCEHEGGGFE